MKPSRPARRFGPRRSAGSAARSLRRAQRVDHLPGRESGMDVDARDRDDHLSRPERLVLQLARALSRRSCTRNERRTVDIEQRPALPISSSGVNAMRTVGRGSSGWHTSDAIAAMIAATPALSSAPSSVSPTRSRCRVRSWRRAPASRQGPGAFRAPELDHAAVVVTVHDRRNARPGGIRRGVNMRDQAERGVAQRGPMKCRAVAGLERGHQITARVEARIGDAEPISSATSMRASSNWPGVLGVLVLSRSDCVSICA